MRWPTEQLVELRDHLDKMLEDVIRQSGDEFGRGYYEGIKAVRDDVDGWLPRDLQRDGVELPFDVYDNPNRRCVVCGWPEAAPHAPECPHNHIPYVRGGE